MQKRRVWIAVAIAACGTILLLPPFAFRWWQDRGEWFPMRVGDRWAYRDGFNRERIVFEAVQENPDGSFVVERRRGVETVTFTPSVTPKSVFILETTGGRFDPPFEEFRLPEATGDAWTYDGRFGAHPVRIASRRERTDRRRIRVEEESSPSGWSTFTLERGKGVVRLVGKGTDVHGNEGFRGFNWTLEKFERRG